MPGLFERLGSFAKKVYRGFQSGVEAVERAIGIGREVDIDVSPPDAYREWSHVVNLEGRSEQISNLEPNSMIPPDLYTEAEIPWNRPFAYEVTMSGRDLNTGRFARTERVITASRELTIAEIEELAMERFSGEGAYPQLDVTHLSVTGAETRPGESPF
jgi:hypothetical protein